MKNLSDHQEECLNILQEECSEVIQAASKIKRFGLTSFHPDDPLCLTNLENLETELGDVLALIDMCKHAGIGITDQGLGQAKAKKMARLGMWMHTWSQSPGNT
jgi:NTP pyrophosphatase (non-canonical NTP hydrolase)